MSNIIQSLLRKLPSKIYKSAQKIISNYTSGSQELNEKILLLLLQARSLKTINNLISIFKLSFQRFAVIQNSLNRLEKETKKSDLQRLKSLIKKIINTQNSRFEKLFKKVQKKIFEGIKILTFSNSYTCFKLFEKIYQNGFEPEFYIPESNPGGEGKILYRNLKEIGAKCQFVSDENLNEIITKIDIIIVGADKIFPEHFIINKVGTERLAKLAKKYSKPFYVVCLKEKVVSNKEALNDEKSLIRKKENELFEKIEIDLITEVFMV